MVSKHIFARRTRGVAAVRTGASLVAMLAAGTSASAWAQAETQAIAPNATQEAAPGQDVGAEAAVQGDGEIVVIGRRAALEAADERKRRLLESSGRDAKCLNGNVCLFTQGEMLEMRRSLLADGCVSPARARASFPRTLCIPRVSLPRHALSPSISRVSLACCATPQLL